MAPWHRIKIFSIVGFIATLSIIYTVGTFFSYAESVVASGKFDIYGSKSGLFL
jgi:hypothetical protein